jgi:DNA-binding NarL/FixJ family response regulator
VLKVFLYDKNPSQVQAVKTHFKTYKFIESIETGTNAKDSFIRSRQIDTDIIFWGINKPKSLDFDFFEELLQDRPQRPVVNLINFRSVSFVSELLECGAFAVIQKTQKSYELENLLDSVFGQLLESAPLHPDFIYPHFSERQIEIFQEITRGLENSEICSRLSLRYETVRSHMKNMARELNSQGREQLVAQGFRSRVLH